MVQFDEDSQLRKSAELRQRQAEEFAQLASSRLGIPYVDLSTVSIGPDALGLMDEAKARASKIAIFRAAGNNIDVAVFSPQSPDTEVALADLKTKGFIATLHLTTEASLERAWKYYEDIQKIERTKVGQIDISGVDLASFASKIKTIEDTKKIFGEILAGESTSQVTAVLEVLLASSITLGISDIHLEPEEHAVRARFRLDGILQDVASFDAHIYKLVLSRIKLLSTLKLNVESARQDGRFSVLLSGVEIDIRTSIIPGAYGEAAVMRILNPAATKVKLQQLGMSDQLLEIVRKEINKPNGLILNTGPTGSGKTTTLYTFLREVNEPGVKIITIEDPVEYHIEGLVQTQVNEKKGYTFAEGLKSAMRQDPDIIMVGEIRDNDTATTAVDAALTGHLVFSTLHTNNAAGTIPRLVDLGVNTSVLGPALSVAMAQRLVRTLCKECRTLTEPDERTKAIITRLVASLAEIGITPPQTEKVGKPVGCAVCNNTGFKGRIGIFEVILVDDAIGELIASNPGEGEIMKAARIQKIPDMREDGIMKLLQGLTTIEELERVVDLS